MATPRKKPEDKLKTGRPSDYRPEYCQRMVDYFSIDIWVKSPGSMKKELGKFPTFQGFAARELGVCMQTLHNWSNEFPEFLAAFKKCKLIQEQILVEGGLTRAYDGGFAKFILNSVSDTFKEKVEHTVDDDTKGLIKLAYNLPVKNKE